ncbi:hypothetical protein amb3085 [Paramagnetospirillum magneticum AMB-1]|uniref:Uncharacterized protein n=1 Tax=Paramagnetospirillum magneticum (strain ATCC 700264 / AMB-1) TaxID=342108 RepID=Q2W2N6_PARM1|nr:hypothetical protein amb3085 [Paramagnetospirillum magneticum AMB-1]
MVPVPGQGRRYRPACQDLPGAERRQEGGSRSGQVKPDPVGSGWDRSRPGSLQRPGGVGLPAPPFFFEFPSLTGISSPTGISLDPGKIQDLTKVMWVPAPQG